MTICYYLLADGTCGVTAPRLEANCQGCPDYEGGVDPFWEVAGSDPRERDKSE